MAHTSGLVFRTAGTWGPGKGSNLTPTEVDENFDDLDERLDTLETTPPTPVEISSITVTGSSMTVNMSDGSDFGPFTLPTATFDFRGDWAPLTQYFINDVFFVSDSGVYLVTTDFESATAFDPGGAEITKMFPDVAIDTLDDVSDVDYTTAGPAEGDVLVRRSGAWVPEPQSSQTATVQTSDATQTVLASAPMAAGSAHTIHAIGHGREDATGDTYHFQIFGGARNEAGTSSAPTPNVIEVADAGAATWDATLVANDASDEWEIKVTGEAAHTIDWTVTYFEIITQP